MAMTPADFGPFTLSASSHENPQDGMCVMEMVSFLAGEEWSDMPPCSSPIVARYCQILNDRSDQAGRDRLQTYVPRLIGTASPEHDQDRAEYLAWAAIRIFAPIALDACGLPEHAERLRNFDGGLSAAAGDAGAAAYAARAAGAAARAADDAGAAAYAARAARAAGAAARAARAAAYAARAAARAAADAAADDAGAAAYAAYAAADTAGAADAMFDVLDGLLEIGPSGQSYEAEHINRAHDLHRAIATA